MFDSVVFSLFFACLAKIFLLNDQGLIEKITFRKYSCQLEINTSDIFDIWPATQSDSTYRIDTMSAILTQEETTRRAVKDKELLFAKQRIPWRHPLS
jgi:hypothetical protein